MQMYPPQFTEPVMAALSSCFPSAEVGIPDRAGVLKPLWTTRVKESSVHLRYTPEGAPPRCTAADDDDELQPPAPIQGGEEETQGEEVAAVRPPGIDGSVLIKYMPSLTQEGGAIVDRVRHRKSRRSGPCTHPEQRARQFIENAFHHVHFSLP